jgi:ferrochelatase
VPWLEPDVNDALELLAERGVGHVVVVPIGFLSDHMEVVWDLDTQAKATATRLGIDLVRVPTVGTHPAFVSGMARVLADLARTQPTITHRASDGAERQDGIREAATTELLAGTRSGNVVPIATPAFCSTDCCPNPRGSRPVVAGVALSGGVSL